MTQNRKLRLLMCTEASYLLTGFAVYSKQLLTRLYNTGKYEIAELGNYGDISNPKQIDKIDAIPWKFYANMPSNDEERKVYESNQLNQFGAWKFESVCLDFKPNIVFSVLDPWMTSYQIYSPFRQYYKLAQMPTVDAEPLLDEWIYDYMQADAVFAYTNWGLEIMQKESSGLIKTRKSTPGGVDLQSFFPVQNKPVHRKQFGINEESLIIGMVARNQPRKLFPQLLEDFSIFINKVDPSLASRTFLYLHTSYPDIGWAIPRYLNRFGIGHKVLFTYHCKNCGAIACQLYKDVLCFCDRCKQLSMTLPHNLAGLSPQALGAIYNLMDCYIQYATCEGLGIPVVEASHCGVPCMVVDYSGMHDFVSETDAIPIEPKGFFVDTVTGRYMALPDRSDFINKLTQILSMPSSIRYRLGLQQMQKAMKKFNWDDTVNNWMEFFDSVEPNDNWKSPPRFHQIPNGYPDGLSNDKFINWCLINVAGRPELINSYPALRMIKELTWGITFGGGQGLNFNDLSMLGSRPRITEFNRDIVFQQMKELGISKNFWEHQRCLNQ